MQRAAKRILVIGGAGYVGTAFCSLLASRHETFAVYDNFSANDTPTLPPQATLYKGDVRSLATLEKAFNDFKPTHVVLLAALHFIPYCVEHPEEVMAVNVLGVQNVLDVIKKQQAPIELLFSSSAAVYKDCEEALSEESDLEQIDIYGFSKALGERLIASQNQCYKIVRFFNVYGNHDVHPHVIPRVFEELHHRNEFLKVGNVEAERDYVHVDDVARALMDVLEKGKNKTAYNIGTGETLSVEALIHEMMMVVGHRPKLVANTAEYARKTDRKVLRADIARITKDTGWRPTIGIKEGLATLR